MAKKQSQAAKLAKPQQSWTDQAQQTASAHTEQAAPEKTKRTRTSFNVRPDHMQILYDLQAKLARTGKRPSMSDLIEEALADLGKKHGIGE